MGLDYRLVREDDLPGIQRLWKEETSWGTLAEELWQRLVVGAPEWGGISGAVATDDSGAVVRSAPSGPVRPSSRALSASGASIR